MADDAEDKEPEAPEAVVWARWAGHHLFREGAVIRRAPLATIVMAVAMFFAAKWFVENQDAGKINGLNGVIETKSAEIQFLDDRLQTLETKAPEGATTSRAKFKSLMITRGPDVAGKYGWMQYFQNIGNGVAIGPIHEGGATIEQQQLTKEAIDAIFKSLHKKIDADKKLIATSEYQPNDMMVVTYNNADLDGARVDPEVVKGGSYMYNMSILAYRDSDTPPHKWRMTEYCGFTARGQMQINCDSHNRIYLED